ncbi:MAPEG family protein [Microdochium nivale]|nr:MAPEG family protein [Microdochium nivale]
MTSMLGSVLDRNISYFTVIPALILPLSARYISGLSGPGKKLFDKNNPRGHMETLRTAEIDKELRARLIRAEACCANGFEALPLFAAGVAAGNAAGVAARTMNLLSVGWIASRVLYTYVFISYQGREKLAYNGVPMRTKVWTVSISILMSMFVVAGLQK